MLQYVYLLREREFIRLNENTFKVGKTAQEPYKRFSGYPKGSEVLAFIAVGDCHKMETEILEHFRENFQQRKEYGSEYFQGDPDKIIHSFLLCVSDPFVGFHRRLANRAPDTAPSALDSDSSTADSDDADSAANEPLLDLNSPVILLEDQCTPNANVDAPANVLTFGRHKGMTVRDVKILDEQYLRWLLRELIAQADENPKSAALAAVIKAHDVKPLPPGAAARHKVPKKNISPYTPVIMTFGVNSKS